MSVGGLVLSASPNMTLLNRKIAYQIIVRHTTIYYDIVYILYISQGANVDIGTVKWFSSLVFYAFSGYIVMKLLF